MLVCLFVYRSVCLTPGRYRTEADDIARLSIYLFVCQFVCFFLFVCLSVFLFVCLSADLYV